jgi:hypothetical protein
MRLTYAERKRFPASDFVYPRSRRYPIENKAHARDALARVSANGTPAEKRAVYAAVERRYPGIVVHEHLTLQEQRFVRSRR